MKDIGEKNIYMKIFVLSKQDFKRLRKRKLQFYIYRFLLFILLNSNCLWLLL